MASTKALIISHMDCCSNWCLFHPYISYTASKVIQRSKLILKPFNPSATEPSPNSYLVYKTAGIWSLSTLAVAFATIPSTLLSRRSQALSCSLVLAHTLLLHLMNSALKTQLKCHSLVEPSLMSWKLGYQGRNALSWKQQKTQANELFRPRVAIRIP